MPSETVPEWGEAQLQEALAVRYGALADTAREEIAEWLQAGDTVVVAKSAHGRYQFARLASSRGLDSAILPEGTQGYSIVGCIRSNPLGQIS